MTENNVASVAADYAKSVKERTKADRHERDNSYLWLTGNTFEAIFGSWKENEKRVSSYFHSSFSPISSSCGGL